MSSAWHFLSIGRLIYFRSSWYTIEAPLKKWKKQKTMQLPWKLSATSFLHCHWSTAASYDRACRFYNAAIASCKDLKRIKTWAVDRFHAQGHSKRCKCSPLVKKNIDKHLKGTNTSICEQTFSWFRGYACSFHTMSAPRQRFLVLALARRHNILDIWTRIRPRSKPAERPVFGNGPDLSSMPAVDDQNTHALNLSLNLTCVNLHRTFSCL